MESQQNSSGVESYISGNRLTSVNNLDGQSISQVAVNSTSHILYATTLTGVRAFDADGEPSLFSTGPGAGTSEIGGFTALGGVAVDANGYIYVSDRQADVGGDPEADLVRVFAPTGEQVTQFTTTEPANLAVDSHGAVYVNRWESTVRKYTPSVFPVDGTTTYTAAAEPLSPNQSYTVAVDPSTDNVYVAQRVFSPTSGRIAIFDVGGNLLTTLAGSGEEGELGVSQGIGIDEGSGRVFVANKPISDQPPGRWVRIFDPVVPKKPVVEFLSSSEVGTDSAVLHARINPERLETSYRFEYGLEDCSASVCAVVPVGGGEIAAGEEGVVVSQAIGGLQAGTTYHYRVVATNELGEDEDHEEDTFTTESSGGDFALADRRVWEMVSPPNKHGGTLVGATEGPIQARPDGEAITYLSRGSIEADPEGNRAPELSSVLSRRSGSGWTARDLTVPNERLAPISQSSEYKLFTPDLSEAVIEPTSGTPLSEQASERTPYLRENSEPPQYTPLVTGKEGFANVPEGTEFGGPPSGASPIKLESGNSRLDDVVLSSSVPLAAGAPNRSLYHWTGGQLKALSVVPAEGGEEEKTIGPATLGSGQGSVENAVSEDGSRIFWAAGVYEATGSNLKALYMRDTEAEETVRLDVALPDATNDGAANPVFQGADPDGSVVFFTDTQQLTKGASPSGRDLYRCEVSPAVGCATLTDVSAPLAGSGKSADVQGIVSGLSEDATRLYFVAKGALDTAANEFGETAVAGEPNLYLWQEEGGIRFVATLSTEDAAAWGGKEAIALAARRNTGISPSGRYLSFMSERSLTGEDNLNPLSEEAVERVFRYDALEDRLDCVSCNPTGAAPDGEAGAGTVVDPRRLWVARAVAAILPQAPTMATNDGRPISSRPRAVLDNGRVFFNSIDALVAADSNGGWDVYQYEPTGVGECTAASGDADTVRSAGGCVSLLSSGTGDEEAGFLDASESGEDVFFLTPARLSVTDVDDQLDLYDARVDGIEATLHPVSECQGEACQAVPSPPVDPTPASEAFRGPGNVKPKRCAKGKHKVRRNGKTRCVAKKKSGKKTNNKKRATQGRRPAR